MRLIRRFVGRTEGQDLIEYALLSSLISVLVVIVLASVGAKLTAFYEDADAALGAVGDASAGGGGNGGGNGNGNGNGNNNGNGNGNGNGGGRGH